MPAPNSAKIPRAGYLSLEMVVVSLALNPPSPAELLTLLIGNSVVHHPLGLRRILPLCFTMGRPLLLVVAFFFVSVNLLCSVYALNTIPDQTSDDAYAFPTS